MTKRKLLNAVGVSVFVVCHLLLAVPAGAHASCDSASPADGTSLSAAPSTVSCRYTEPPTQNSTMWVTDACNRRADDGKALIVGTQMSVGMTAKAPSLYTVSWRATSQLDGHKTFGQWTFTVEGQSEPCGAKTSGASAEPKPDRVKDASVRGGGTKSAQPARPAATTAPKPGPHGGAASVGSTEAFGATPAGALTGATKSPAPWASIVLLVGSLALGMLATAFRVPPDSA